MKIKKRGYWKKGHYISQSNTGYWSKWGGGRYHGDKENLDRWSCQACSEIQFGVMPQYLFEISDGEYIRICVFCRYILVLKDLSTLQELVGFVRKPDILALIANLATLPLRF